MELNCTERPGELTMTDESRTDELPVLHGMQYTSIYFDECCWGEEDMRAMEAISPEITIMEYEIQCTQTRDTVWIHSSDGSTVARFGKMGVDLHNTVTEQLGGEPQCRLCTHGAVTLSDWELFREKCLEWWNVTVPVDAFDPKYLVEQEYGDEYGT